ncbi:MAG: hypothetical protein WCA84_15655 [Ignavibacteriaceae bacterium]|jgi:hypothetical protein
MQKSNHIYDLFEHMQWADATVWQIVLNTAGTENDGKLKVNSFIFIWCNMLIYVYGKSFP